MADDGEVEGGIGLSGPTAVFVKGRVERPVEIVFDSPMGANGVEDRFRIGFERRDAKSGFAALGAGFLVDAPVFLSMRKASIWASERKFFHLE